MGFFQYLGRIIYFGWLCVVIYIIWYVVCFVFVFFMLFQYLVVIDGGNDFDVVFDFVIRQNYGISIQFIMYQV